MDKRIALVVGATGTLGQAITKNLINKNIQLILLAKNTEKLEKIYDEIIDIALFKPKMIPLDLNHGRSVDKLGGLIFEKYKKLDILINCSSFYPKLSPINHILPKEFSKIIDINISTSWRLIRAFDPLLRNSRYGRSYFFICKQKKYQEPYFSSYKLSSDSIESLVNSWKKELSKTNIKVFTYDPGPIKSKLRKSAFPGEYEKNTTTAKIASDKFINFLESSYES